MNGTNEYATPTYLNSRHKGGDPSSGPAVLLLQIVLRVLLGLGLLGEDPSKPMQWGLYCRSTELLVCRLQNWLGTGEDGDFGPATRLLLRRRGIDLDCIRLADLLRPGRYADRDDVMQDWGLEEETLFPPALHHEDTTSGETPETTDCAAVLIVQLKLTTLQAARVFADIVTSDASSQAIPLNGKYCETTLYWEARWQEVLGFPRAATSTMCGQDGHFGPHSRRKTAERLRGFDVNVIPMEALRRAGMYAGADGEWQQLAA